MRWPPLAQLTETERQLFMGATTSQSFAIDQVVFAAGDPADSLHLVITGHFAVRVALPGAERETPGVLIHVLRPGDTFGELSLLPQADPTSRSATVVALEAGRTRVVPAAAFRALCEEHPRIQQVLSSLLADRVRALSGQLLEARYLPVEHRVRGCLAELFSVDGSRADPVTLPLRPVDVADLVGGSTEEVRDVLDRMARAGVLTVADGRLTLDQPAALHTS